MKRPPTERAVCEHCGETYDHDLRRRCVACDGAGCPHCLADMSEPRCPDCVFGGLPADIEPMLAVEGAMPADPAAWAFEFKWDGVRALGSWDGRRMRLASRNLRDITQRYPDLVPDAGQMANGPVIVDGEIVACDRSGRPSFPLLQRRMHAGPARAERLARQVPVQLFLFDLLWRGSESLLERPYAQRRELLESLELGHPRWRVPPSHRGEGPAMLETARRFSLEGLVAKRPDAPYRPGERSPAWRKIKIVHRQELVVGGWEPRRDGSDRIGALLVGHWSPQHLGLRFAGRVGTGFDARTHRELRRLLEQRPRTDCPFEDDPDGREARWVEPVLVAEVAYRRWPPGGVLHQASFLGLRDDVEAFDIVLDREG